MYCTYVVESACSAGKQLLFIYILDQGYFGYYKFMYVIKAANFI